MNLYVILLSAFASLALETRVSHKPITVDAAARWGYPPKHCYNDVCENLKICKYAECNRYDTDHICGCNKEMGYYFENTAQSGGHGHDAFFFKKVCVNYKLCNFKKTKICPNCTTEKKCEKVELLLDGKY